MTRRRPEAAVYSTATPWQTEDMPARDLARTWRRTPGVIPPQATGVRDDGGVIGAGFHLPSFDTNASTPPAPAPPAAAPGTPPPSDCCG